LDISVLGCGRWGTFLAWYLDSIGHRVNLWGRKESAALAALKSTHSNETVTLPLSVSLTDDLAAAVASSDTLIISISAQGLRGLMQQLESFDLSQETIVLCMKGIEEKTGLRLSQVVEEYVPDTTKVAVWIGPGHVQNFAAGISNCMVLDSKCEETKTKLADAFSGSLIRFYYGTDLIGNEIGAAAKNVIGIAAGMLDGLSYTSLKGALMARGAHEISRLIGALGGNPMSAYGLAHLGDYEATVFSLYSHNRMYGECFVQNRPFDKLAEGVSTMRALMDLKDQYGVDLPICEGVHRIIDLGQDPKEVLSDLFLRSLKKEF